jgi:hypothetical protein
MKRRRIENGVAQPHHQIRKLAQVLKVEPAELMEPEDGCLGLTEVFQLNRPLPH